MSGLHVRVQWDRRPAHEAMKSRAPGRRDRDLKIGDLANASGYSAKTLRFYEEVGLIKPTDRTAAGYRLYDPAVVERLALVRNAQDLGFRLEDVRNILDAGDAGDDPCIHTLQLVDRELEHLKKQAARLRELRRNLLTLRERVSGELGKTSPNGGLCSCLTDSFDGQRRAMSAAVRQSSTRKEERRGLSVP